MNGKTFSIFFYSGVIIAIIFLFFLISLTVQHDTVRKKTDFMECMELIDETQWCYNKFILGK